MGFFKKVGKSIKKGTKSVTKAISNTAEDVGGEIKDVATDAGNEIAHVATEAVNEVENVATEIGDEIVSEANATAKFVESAAGEVWDDAIDALDAVKNFGEDIISGVERTFGATGGVISPTVNMNCEIPTGFLSPFGILFKTLLLLLLSIFAIVYFIMPLFVVVYITFTSCKMNTIDVFKNMKNLCNIILKKHVMIRTLFCLLILFKMIYLMKQNASISALVPLLILFTMEITSTILDNRKIKENGKTASYHPIWSILNKCDNNNN